MPQLVPKLNIFIRYGGYEPSTGFHFPTAFDITQDAAETLAGALQNMLTPSITITEWEGRNPDGSFIAGGTIGLTGTNLSDFDDYRDCSHIQWMSSGQLRPSGNYLPGRSDNQWNRGIIDPSFRSDVEFLAITMRGLGVTDSEGFFINDIRRVTTSRRRRMRQVG